MIIDFHLFVDNLVGAIEAKDQYTAGHSSRVAEIASMISKKMNFSEEESEAIHIAGHLHDIGKIGIPDGILLKTGKLSAVEYEVMKTHSEIGYGVLKDNKKLESIPLMVLHHHERYDGKGYPYQLAGEDIPLGARILAVADSFDAMVSRRTYKHVKSFKEAQEDIIYNKGKQFDPRVADAFISICKSKEDRHIVKELYYS